ncbi:MAG TPA: zinc-binding dehydrogenase [Rhodothermales bacterium]|nr:zinc-binding dehydrogenase [Rhodothermales bacterium]
MNAVMVETVRDRRAEGLHTAREPRVAVFAGPQEIRIEAFEPPAPGAGEVRVRLEGCGVCASNIPVWEGRPWFQYPMEPGGPGHEGWGVIDAVGEGVEGLSEGDRVAMLSYHAYATHDLAPATDVVKLPESLEGQPFPGEPLGCALNIFRRSEIEAGQTVAILGVGFLGALLTKLASEAGAHVIAVSRRPFSREIAHAMGAAEILPMEDHGRVIEEVRSLTDGRMCERVIEAVGKQGPLDLAGELTCERGRMMIAGYHQDGARQVNMQLWNWRGIDVINAHEREQAVYLRGIRDAAEAVVAGRIDPAPLFTNTFTLEELPDALRMAQERPEGFMKALVMC